MTYVCMLVLYWSMLLCGKNPALQSLALAAYTYRFAHKISGTGTSCDDGC